MSKTEITNQQPDDLIEQLSREWARECPELDTQAMLIIGRIMRLGRQYEKEASEALKPFDLPYTDFDIIATLRRSGPPYELTPGALSKSVLLTSGAMTAALDRLQGAELITRHASDVDRRVKTARLTTKGQQLAKTAAEARFEAADKAVSVLSSSARQDLKRILRQL